MTQWAMNRTAERTARPMHRGQCVRVKTGAYRSDGPIPKQKLGRAKISSTSVMQETQPTTGRWGERGRGWLVKLLFIALFRERMSQVTVGENEGIESALRRFKRSVAKAGIFSDLRRIRHHETPVEKYKRKLKQRSRNRRR